MSIFQLQPRVTPSTRSSQGSSARIGAMQSSFTIEQQPVSPSPRRSFATTALVGVLGLFAVACLYSSGDTSALRAQQRLRGVL